MGKANCLISIADYGAHRVKATRVTHGMSVVAYSGEGVSRRGRAFYPSKRTSGSFELDLVFTTYGGYRKIANWLERYSRWASNPKSLATPVRVVIPSRNFDKVGVLEEGLTFGDVVAATSYTMTLAFVGSRDPMEMNGRNLSMFRLPKNIDDPALPYLYPAGTQLKVGETGFDTIYDEPVEDLVNPGGNDYDPPGGLPPSPYLP